MISVIRHISRQLTKVVERKAINQASFTLSAASTAPMAMRAAIKQPKKPNPSRNINSSCHQKQTSPNNITRK